MKQGLKRGIVVVFLANIINLIINLLSGFILPKELSVETYAAIKTFQLYASYTGVLHFGFVDGIYLKYGGRNLSDIGTPIIERNLSTMRIFQLCVAIVGVIAGLVSHNYILAIFGLYIMPTNILSFFQYLYQAVGEFDSYSRILNGTNILKFAINLFLIFIINTDLAYLYILVFFIVELIIWIVIEIMFVKRAQCKFTVFSFSFADLWDNIKNGIALTVGNLSSIFLTGMDRWFIKILLDTMAFAQYSFAVSMENLLSVAITPITVTLYNYFCNESDENKIRRVRNSVQVFAAFLITSAFPAKFILETYLQKYIDSVNVMFLLFGAQLFYVVVKSVYVNLYKAHKEQNKYFIRLVSIIGIGFIFNVLCYLVYHGKEAFAVGTMLSAFVWLLLCIHDNKGIRYSIKEFIYLIIQECVFLTCGMLFSSAIGFVIYILITLFSSWIFLRQDFLFLIDNAKSMARNAIAKMTAQ